MKVGQKTFVSLSYELRVDGQVVDSTTAEYPLEFVYGAGYLLPKFEEKIDGLEKGDKFEFTLTPTEGYGEVIEDAVTELPKDVFMIDGSIEEGLLEVGNQIPMSTGDGQRLVGIVTEINDDSVKMDFNHPMAGKTLNFTGEIVNVREATDEDIMQTMSSGGGCGDCDCDDSSCGDNGCSAGCGCN